MLIVTADHVTFLRPNGSVAIKDFTWQWQAGEAWAIVGDTGSGKTTLLEGLLGRWRLGAGSVDWFAEGARVDFPETIAKLVAFRDSNTHGYYQQRYEFADTDEPLSLRDYVGCDDEPLLETFGLTTHLDQPFVTLSNGQMRKARIVKSLRQRPQVLMLDDPFLGLDVEARKDLAALLGTLTTQVLLTCRPDDLPAHVTHVIEMSDSQVRFCGAIQSFRAPNVSEGIRSKPSPALGARNITEPVIELHDVTVRHGGRVILDRVSWTVGRGERWALTGANGAGKTTLLSLVVGDHPQAFSNDVRLFGSRRGSGETVWDIRRRVGFVSPEFHLYFAEDLTAAEAAETGFTDTLLHSPVTAEQQRRVIVLFQELGIAELINQRMRRLSTGQQRLALLVRALVKQPPLLVLDEPYQGLDTKLVARLNAWLEQHLTAEQTLIVTTHRIEELPSMVDRRLALKDGIVI